MIAAGIDYLESSADIGLPITDEPESEPTTVIFLHGIGGSALSFRSQLEGLANRTAPTYRAIAWNMPGYGSSVRLEAGSNFSTLSQTLGDFIDELALDAVHLVGQSIGGMLTIEHAIRRPEQVKTLSLIATTPRFGGSDDSFKAAFLKARLAPLDAGLSMAEMAAQAIPHLLGPSASCDCVAEVEEILATVPQATWRRILECLITFNRRDDLSTIQQPCCVIAGGHDQNSPAKTMRKMVDELPRAEYHLLDTAGHMINQEAPIETNRILQHFLDQHSQ